jgi:hypothetical protein
MKVRMAVSICFALLCSVVSFVSAQNATSPRGFIVVDSNGRQLGPVIGVMQGTAITTVAISAAGRWLPVYVQRSVFQFGSLEYTTMDCTGQPYENAGASPFPVSSVVTTSKGNVLYGEDGPEGMVDINSFLDASSGMCIQSSYTDPDAVPMAPAISLNVFVPPFKAVAR